jgi:hypothetical protein
MSFGNVVVLVLRQGLPLPVDVCNMVPAGRWEASSGDAMVRPGLMLPMMKRMLPLR